MSTWFWLLCHPSFFMKASVYLQLNSFLSLLPTSRILGVQRPLFISYCCYQFSSVHFNGSVVSNSLRPHGLQHARLPCPSPTPRACSNACPLSQWCHPTISSSVIPFSSCLQSFPASGSFQMSQLFAWGGQSIGVSASTSDLPMNPGLISFRMDWLDLPAVQGTLKSLQHHSSKASVLQHSAFFIVQLSHPYMTTGKTIVLTRRTFVGKVMSLRFDMLSRLVITFLPRSKCLLISWVQSPSAVILEPPPNKVSHCFHCFPIYLPWSDGTRCHDLSFLNVDFPYLTMIFDGQTACSTLL